jgi:hypothetical protein
MEKKAVTFLYLDCSFSCGVAGLIGQFYLKNNTKIDLKQF